MRNFSNEPAVILVVEDEVLVRSATAMQLEEAGFRVIEACDAEEALWRFEHDDAVTTVFTDINMPGAFDGLSLAHQIFQRRPHVRLILTSGRQMPAISDMPAGVHFLHKPYDCIALTSLINAA